MKNMFYVLFIYASFITLYKFGKCLNIFYTITKYVYIVNSLFYFIDKDLCN